MKHFFKLTLVAAVITAGTLVLSSFAEGKKEKNTAIDSYSIQLTSKCLVGTCEQWTWVLTNPNPGNGNNGTLQDVSHFDIPLTADAEAALVSAEYSFDGITWYSVPLSVDRDPTIRACTSVDVLKFDVGTIGTAPTYYRITFSDDFDASPWAKCYIKTGGGRTGCNMYYFTGVYTRKLD